MHKFFGIDNKANRVTSLILCTWKHNMQCTINLATSTSTEYDSLLTTTKRGSGGNGSGINGVRGI